MVQIDSEWKFGLDQNEFGLIQIENLVWINVFFIE